MTASINVYQLPQVVNLTLAPTTGADLMNYSATRSDFKVMKGITTIIHFFIKNTDRVPVKFESGETIDLVVTDQERNHTIGTFRLELDNEKKSIWKVSLQKEVTQDWPLTSLSYSLVVNRPLFDDKVMLYLDRGHGGYSDIHVLTGPFPEPKEPDVFRTDDFLEASGSLFSTSIKASPDDNFPQHYFSAGFYAENFSGFLKVQASLEEQPDTDDQSWFDIEERHVRLFTGIEDFNFEGSYVWLRFVIRYDGPYNPDYHPDTHYHPNATVSKVLLRRS